MKKLILITREFPFHKGETFLENEIGILSNNFDEVIIYPIDICIDEKETRKIDKYNIKVRPLNTEKLNKRKIKFIIDSLKIRQPHIIPHTTETALFAKAVVNGSLFIICCHPIAYKPSNKIIPP